MYLYQSNVNLKIPIFLAFILFVNKLKQPTDSHTLEAKKLHSITDIVCSNIKIMFMKFDIQRWKSKNHSIASNSSECVSQLDLFGEEEDYVE